ncbi:hypothetical protein V491_00551 [Pseudogymnoascus sp. VKM F-3775]|nr:hypothetical protein V491_00551 [Pseudogymnoascus sp. VKM F-3775]
MCKGRPRHREAFLRLARSSRKSLEADCACRGREKLQMCAARRKGVREAGRAERSSARARILTDPTNKRLMLKGLAAIAESSVKRVQFEVVALRKRSCSSAGFQLRRGPAGGSVGRGHAGSEYNDIPVDPGPKNISTFEKPSSSYGWLHSLWANIISAKWGGNVMPATSDLPAPIKISKPLSYNSEPSHLSISPARPGSGNWRGRNDASRKSRPRTLKPLPTLRPLSYTDWRAEEPLEDVTESLYEEGISPVPDSSPDGATRSMFDNFLTGVIEDALFQAGDLEEIEFLATQFAVDSDLLRKAMDSNLFKDNPPAWETIAYLSGKECKVEDVRKIYLEGQYNVNMLGSLLACETEGHRVSIALWRIWAYCILSVDSMITGECIAIQVAWLRGPTVDRALLGKARFDGGVNENWRLCRTNGVFAQSNIDIRQHEADDMRQIWDLLRKKWLEVMNQEFCDEKTADRYIMHIFSRASGPRDILNILERSHPPSFTFHGAFRITRRRSKLDEFHGTAG